ncbi:MAG: hypothetical protein GY757_50470, partial [bacterium]|nr:hypothetical protein [bacterium]
KVKELTTAGTETKKQVAHAMAKLKNQIQTADNVSSLLSKQSENSDITIDAIMETSKELTTKIDGMQRVLDEITLLKKQFDLVETTTETLLKTTGEIKVHEKRLENLTGSDGKEIELARKIFNREMKLSLTTENSVAVLEKLQGEIIESIEYRNFAINLFKEFRFFEQNHVDKWYWKLIKPVKDALMVNKEAFYRNGGKTIYDGFVFENGDIAGGDSITKEHLKTVINEKHWGQIWEPVIKAAWFFEAYYQPDYSEVMQLMGISAKKIIYLMENFLGYRVDTYMPLQQIPAAKLESREIEEALNHYLFYQEILPNIKTNQRFVQAGRSFETNGGEPMIVYLESVGLVDNGKQIRVPKAVLYSPTAVSQSR